MTYSMDILTLSGRKSGNNSVTSTLAYFDGSMAANGVSSLLSVLLDFSNLEGLPL